jgi:hypothetical protein
MRILEFQAIVTLMSYLGGSYRIEGEAYGNEGEDKFPLFNQNFRVRDYEVFRIVIE